MKGAADPLNVLLLEPRVHRKREDLVGILFGNGKGPFGDSQAFIGLLQVDRSGVVNQGANVLGGQKRLQLVPPVTLSDAQIEAFVRALGEVL
jgi:hypothetical protein